MRLFLGVDGGQSSTTAVIGDETGLILGRGAGGPCNHAETGEGRRKLERAVSACVAMACEQAGLDAATVQFEAACFGMSGGPQNKRDILAAMLRTRRLLVTTDAAIALAGATETGQGIIMIAGTGSMALGRNASGRTVRAGGWGYIYGDEGGAFDIVRQALRAALRMEEGWGPATELRRRLLVATGSANANEALHRFYSDEWPRARQASLARLVDETAADGDVMAVEILAGAAGKLAGFVGAVRSQLWRAGEVVTVAYIGGVFHSRAVLERFRGLVESEAGTRCGEPLHGPDAGALLEAYRAVGLNPVLVY